jgi:hypothetical protein
MDQFKDGDSEVINGTTYLRQGGQWHPQSSNGPVFGLPKTPNAQTPAQASQDQLQVTHLGQQIDSQPLQNENTRVNIAQGQTSIQNQRFNQNQGLRQEFDKLPQVQTYGVALQSLGTALKAPDTPQGDLAVIYAYAKAADPGSVVREGEMDMANATASIPQQYRADVMRLTQGKRLPPAVRQGLIETMRQSVSGMRQGYDQQRDRFSQLATQNGFKPEEIIGQPLYEAYRSAEEAYIQAHGGTPRDPNTPQQEVAPPAPTTTEQGFGLKPSGSTPSASSEDFRNQLYSAMRSKQIKSPAEIKSFQDQYNQSHGTGWQIDTKNPETRKALAAALAGKRFGIEQPIPDISNAPQGSGPAFVRGAADTLTVGLRDKIVAAGDALQNNSPLDYNLARQYAISDADQKNNALARFGGQAAGGFALPMGEVDNVFNLAAKGAGYGAAYGVGSSRSMGDVPGNALIGGFAGAAVPLAIGGGKAALGSFRATPKEVPPLVDQQTGQLNQPLEAMTPGQRVVRAEEYGVNLPADAAGGRTAAVIGKGLDLMPGSAGVMEDARRATESQIAGASDVVASRFGSSRTMNEAGAELQRGANERIDRGRSVATKAYNAIPIHDQAQASTSATTATLQDLTSRFQSNPQLADALKDPKLATYLNAVQKGLSWKDLKDFRSLVGEKIGEARFGESSSTSDLRSLYAGLSEDMQNTAAANGPKAVSAFNRANNLYRNEQQLIDGALTRILGKDGNLAPEKAAAAVQAMTKGGKSTGDLKTLAQIKSATVKSGAWNEIASTLIRLGGQPANSAGRDFSPTTFVNWYADMAEPARQMLFGKSELRQALDGFVAVSQRLQKVNALRNTSNTAGSMTAAGTVGVMGGAVMNPLLGAKLLGVMAGNYGMAKAWTSPTFVRLITGYSKAVATGDQNAVRSQVGRISKLATTNPELREPLQALLKRIANDNTVPSVAASSDSNGSDQQQQR